MRHSFQTEIANKARTSVSVTAAELGTSHGMDSTEASAGSLAHGMQCHEKKKRRYLHECLNVGHKKHPRG
jgi:hypothetical protein